MWNNLSSRIQGNILGWISGLILLFILVGSALWGQSVKAQKAKERCIASMNRIEGAKDYVARKTNISGEEAVRLMIQFREELGNEKCPRGGVYFLGKAGVKVTCSCPGHNE